MNEKQIEYCNIDKWHSKGYTGKGVKIAVLESDVNPSLFGGKVLDPFNVGSYGVRYSHGNNFLHCLFQVAPDVEVHLMPTNYPSSPSIIDGYKYCIEHGIKLYGKSSFLPYGDDVRAVEKQCYDKGMFFICASGNESTDMENYAYSRAYGCDWWYTVGAMHMTNTGEPRPAEYNNYGDELDVMSFSALEVKSLDDDRLYVVTGTSFACPWFLGMMTLVLQKYPKISNVELREFIKNNSIDFGEKDYDTHFGNGVFVLPQEVEDMTIKMKLNDKVAYIDDKKLELDVAPTSIKGRTLVPLRAIAELLGCEVKWDEVTKEITIIKK